MFTILSACPEPYDILNPGVRVPSGLVPDFANYTYESLQTDFLSINGPSYITRLRALKGNGLLDVEATAERIPADLFLRNLGGASHALLSISQTDFRLKIAFDKSTPEDHELFIFGHEIGHIALFEIAHAKGLPVMQTFMNRYKNEAAFRRRIEALCEFFAG